VRKYGAPWISDILSGHNVIPGVNMLRDRIEERWIRSFLDTFSLCGISKGDTVAVLSETQSRQINIRLAELALARMGATPFHIVIPTPPQTAPVPIRSTGASMVIQDIKPVMNALTGSPIIIDCTVEGILHSPQLPEILKSGARVLMVSNEHPDALERLVPTTDMKDKVRAAVQKLKKASTMKVTSSAGTDLKIDLTDTLASGIWGFTDKPGTVSHWPGGVVVTFPKANTVNGTLVLDHGDINLTFKRYLESQVILTIENDYVVNIDGSGTDAELTRRYFAAWGDREAYATSHVGWGMNPKARYEALTLYDKNDTNGTELRCFAGNFLYSTGANEFAGRHTEGHFDIPLRSCSIALDGEFVVKDGELQDGLT
jgi:2,5-dihydroxypyridine 5,6-dioxygenase